MSFILDALKKSESDRQRQTGPALFEVKIAPPKARFPVWAIAIAALLLINMIIVAWMLLRRTSHTEEVAATNNPAAASANNNAATPAGGTDNPAVTAGRLNAPAPAGGTTDYYSGASSKTANAPDGAATSTANTWPAGANAPAPAPAPAVPASSSLPPVSPSVGAQTTTPAAGNESRDSGEPTLAANGRDPGAINADPAATSPDDYAPAAEAGSSLFKGHVRRGTESGLMLYQDAALVPGANLPQLRLDLHVYAAKPQDRFALINMHKMHEGDGLPDGVRVESITPDGVVLSHNGSKFLLPRE